MSFIGNDEIAQVFIGDADVSKIYIGQDLVYEKGATPQEYFVTFSSPNSFTLNTSNNTKNWDGTIEYSTDKTNWSEWDGTTTVNSGVDGKLYLRGTDNTAISSAYNGFTLTGSSISISGNIENILDYEEVQLGNHPTMADGCFYNLFVGNLSIVDCSQLILNATTLSDNCYYAMFNDCSNLIYAPQIKATNFPQGSCTLMFRGCSSLLSAPKMKVYSVSTNCFRNMFTLCTNITGAIDCTNMQSISSNGVFNISQNFLPAIRFSTNLTSITTDKAFGDGVYSVSLSIYYEFTDNDTPQFTLSNAISKGDDKAAMSYKIYTDNTAIKDAVLAQADEYTTVNVYKLDGGSW